MRKRQYPLKRVIQLYVFMLLPLLAGVVLVYMIMYSNQIRENYLSNSKVHLNNLVNQFDADVDAMQKSVDTVFAENISFSKIVKATTDYDWFNALYNLRNILSIKADSINFSGCMFHYNYDHDSLCTLFSNQPYNGTEYDLREAFREYLKTLHLQSRGTGMFVYENETYYISFYHLQGNLLGYCINLSRYFTLRDDEGIVLLKGDEIVAINGNVLFEYEDLRKISSDSGERIMASSIIVTGESEILNLDILYISNSGDLFAFWKWTGFLTVLVLFVLVGVGYSVLMYRRFSRLLLYPVVYISKHLDRLKNTTGNQEKADTSIIEFQSINEQIDDVLKQIIALEEEKLLEKNRADSAMLQYYRLQVNPHFFINSLNNIDSLLDNGSKEIAHNLIQSLSKHFRYVFQDNSHMVNLKMELEEVRSFVNIYSIKGSFPILLNLNLKEELLHWEIPVLTIQTFVENSIKHAGKPGNILKIDIQISEIINEEDNGNMLAIRISDNGPGYSQEALISLNRSVDQYEYVSNNVGINNLKYRLKLSYGDQAFICFYNYQEGGAVVEILLSEEKK